LPDPAQHWLPISIEGVNEDIKDLGGMDVEFGVYHPFELFSTVARTTIDVEHVRKGHA
jgi:hypothetical protein